MRAYTGPMQPISRQLISQRVEEHHQAWQQRKKRLQGEEARYTLVLHSARKELDLTINEYCLADAIHKLSGTRSAVPGWCYASKEQLASSLGVSRQSIHNMINKLKGKGIVEVQAETGHLRSTDLWRDTVEILKTKVFGD